MSVSPVKKMLGISPPEESTARPSGSLTVRKEVDVAIIGRRTAMHAKLSCRVRLPRYRYTTM